MGDWNHDVRSIVLTSSGSNDVFESNSRSKFINKFAKNIDCESGNFEIALSKIKFNNSIYNLPKHHTHSIQFIRVDSGVEAQYEDAVVLSEGYYNSISVIIKKLESTKKSGFTIDIDKQSGKVFILSGESIKVKITPHLGVILGLYSNINSPRRELHIDGDVKFTGDFIANTNQIPQLYIYTDLIQNVHTCGGYETNLLGSCPIKGRFNEAETYEPKHLIFLPVKRQQFIYGSIYITDSYGNPVSFQSGDIEVYTYMRRINPFR